MSAASWRVTSASRRGSSHGDDVPNQDAVRCASVADSGGHPTLVVAVSDGHGGKRYVRSDIGSQYAVDVAVEIVSAAVERENLAPVDLLKGEVTRIVEAWQDRVAAHQATEPFTETETSRSGVGDLTAEPLLAYGATLLVAVVGEEGVGIAQIGDGDALIRTHGFATRPVPGDTRLIGGQTTSLCLDTAPDDFRFAGVPASADPDLVLLASDGYGNSFADTDWWQGLVGDVAWFVDENGFDALEAQLPGWLDESAHVGGDDVTAAVVVREPLVVPPSPPVVGQPAAAAPVTVAPVTAAEPARVPAVPLPDPPTQRTLPLPDDEVVEPDPITRSRGALLAVPAAVAVVAIVAALVLLLGGDDTPQAPGEPTTPTGATSESPSDPSSPRKPRRTRTATESSSPSPTTSPTGPPPRSGGGGAGSP